MGGISQIKMQTQNYSHYYPDISEDVHDGYFIPKGSMIIVYNCPSIYLLEALAHLDSVPRHFCTLVVVVRRLNKSQAILRRPQTYSNPEVFAPERFTRETKEKDSKNICLGSGVGASLWQ